MNFGDYPLDARRRQAQTGGMELYFRRLCKPWSLYWAYKASIAVFGIEGLGMIFIALVLTLAPIVRSVVSGEPFYDSLVEAGINGLTAITIFIPIFLFNWLIRSPGAYADHFREYRAIPIDEIHRCAEILRGEGRNYCIDLVPGIQTDDPIFSVVDVLKAAGWVAAQGSGAWDISRQSTIGTVFECPDAALLEQLRKVFSPYIPDAEFKQLAIGNDLWLTIGHKQAAKP